MISQSNYEELKKEFWDVASWAIWKQPASTSKSNVGDLSVFDDDNLLLKLNTGFVFVGLNGSGKHEAYLESSKAWYNFHSSMPYGHDYKLRFALNETPFWGSYITDIIKYYQEVDSNKVVQYVRSNPNIMKQNIEAFEKELFLLGENPVIVAIGDASYNLLKENLKKNYQIVKIKHYSYTISKENYRKEVLESLSKFL